MGFRVLKVGFYKFIYTSMKTIEQFFGKKQEESYLTKGDARVRDTRSCLKHREVFYFDVEPIVVATPIGIALEDE